MTEALQDYLTKSKEARKAIIQTSKKLYQEQSYTQKMKNLTPRAARNTEKNEANIKMGTIIKQILESDSTSDSRIHPLFSIRELPPDKLKHEIKQGTLTSPTSTRPIKLPYVKLNPVKRIQSNSKAKLKESESLNASVDRSVCSTPAVHEISDLTSKLNKSIDLSSSKETKHRTTRSKLRSSLEITASLVENKTALVSRSPSRDVVSKSYNSISPKKLLENEGMKMHTKNTSNLSSIRARLVRDYGVAPLILRKIKPSDVDTLLTYQRAIRKGKVVSANESNSNRASSAYDSLASVNLQKTQTLQDETA